MGQIFRKVMNENTKKNNNDILELPKYWIKRDSKSRGRPYYFNTRTGQSIWNFEQALKADTTNEKRLDRKPNNNKIKNQNFKQKTKAQERLQKLQSNLKDDQKKVVQNINSSNVIAEQCPSKTSSLSRKPSKEKVGAKNVPIQVVTAHNIKAESNRVKSDNKVVTLKRKLEDDCQSNKVQQVLRKRRSVNDRLVVPNKNTILSENPIFATNSHENTTSRKETKRKLSNLTEEIIKPNESTTKRRSVNDRLKINVSTTEKCLIENQLSSNSFSLEKNVNVNRPANINKKFDARISFEKSSSEIIVDKLFEPMDWEQSRCEQKESFATNINHSRQVDDSSNDFETIEQYLKYKNLLNDQQFEQKCFYTVVDTNVFLTNLSYVASLPKINYKNLGHPVIVVPYVVLQELDNIKHRSDHELSSKAKAAINLINEKLKNRNIYFIGQSAKDDNQKLISIQNPDDNFINCVLQVVEKVGNIVIALSNDKNLRNKIIVNGIDAYSTEELKNKGDDLEIF